MLKYLLLLSTCVIAAVAPSLAPLQADATDEKLPFAGPPPPEELQVLGPLIGQWTSKSEVRPSLQIKEGFTATGETTGQWIHNRQFLRLESTLTGKKYREEATVLYSYDAKKKVYRRWLFTSEGLATESEGQWDEKKRTMTWKPLNLAPNVTGSITDVLTRDRIETTVYLKRDDGQVLVDVTFTATRSAQKPHDELGKRAAEAVDRGLKFLAAAQGKDGTWTDRGSGAAAALTALSVRAFLWAGHAPGQGPYGETVEKGVRAVLKMQQPSGLLATIAGHEMYHHGICTLMLAEAAGKVKGELADDVKKALEKAVRVILQAQRKEGRSQGGWRYRVASLDADLSVTGWQVDALRAAKDAGCEVPAEAFERALAYVRRSRQPQTGGYAYTPGGGVTVPCTASAIICLAACGEKVQALEEARKAGDYILKAGPQTRHFHYAQYHCARAALLLGGNHWTKSRQELFEALLKAQNTSGSWQTNDGYGPIYGTAMAVLALSVETPPLADGKPGEKTEKK